jgi:hypothetical protein
MVRRASSAGRVIVPGVAAAVTAHLEAFADHWETPKTRPRLRGQIAALAEFDLAVTGETIWRATHDPRHPHEWDQFLGDDTLWRITGPDTIEAA